MDPVGPWPAYASYNRLAGVPAGTTSGELHQHLTTGSTTGTPSTTSQILPGTFLSSPHVGYETVFSPLFHHAAKPTTHYVSQHRQALAQVQVAASTKHSSDSEYHQAQPFFDQGTGVWQQNSPFGILPHETVAASASSNKTQYETFNTHFPVNINTQVVAIKNSVARSESPQDIATPKAAASQSNVASFYQVPSTFATDPVVTNKAFSSENTANLQQTCIVTTVSNSPVTKDYRLPSAPTRTFISTSPSRLIEKSFPTSLKQASGQIQIKPQTKIYSELGTQSERQRITEETQRQSSPISYSLDSTGRLSYSGNGTSNKRAAQFQQTTNYRHYQGPNSESDFQRPKNNTDYSNTTNGPDCNVVVPRKPSPLQAHSQASPLGHPQSPAYPMYNSPLNPISSPQSNPNHVTPPSPLDVTLPRPNSQTGNVVYPSVITRTLNNEKNFPEHYERSPQNQTNQNCWDERQAQSRKYQQQMGVVTNNYNSGNIEMANRCTELGGRSDVSLQRTNSLSERQPPYYDSNQGPLQDLSSCRGDPMSIVKNLQQQTCLVANDVVKQEEKIDGKRRKSNDKLVGNGNEVTPNMDYYAGMIPPPAHTSGNNQQPQNGTYYDLDRWNVSASNSKMFGSQNVQQHQGIMVPHPHSHHPPLPYFPTYLPPHSTEYPAVEVTSVNYNEQISQPTTSQVPAQEEHPKVVVPNIEEELNFLCQYPIAKPSNSTSVHLNVNKTSDKNGPGAGFMNSYLKFLQGERDCSPPPPSRGTRKQSWSKKSVPTQEKTDSNGVTPIVPAPRISRPSSQGDPQDDPRYFPLPKERNRNTFDSSDDGFSSDDEIFSKKTPVLKPEPPKQKTRKKGGRSAKLAGPSDRKRAKQISTEQTKQLVDLNEEKLEVIPRRQTGKRAAKEKSSLKQLIAEAEFLEDAQELPDSDSDPAWTPRMKEEVEEDAPVLKKGRRGRQGGRKKSFANIITENSNESPKAPSRKHRTGRKDTNKHIKEKESSENNVYEVMHQKMPQEDSFKSCRLREKQYQTGEFVVIKSDLSQEWPAIWRVDGKTLLQKYEPFEQDGKTFYRNISTYASWTPENKKLYVSIPVKYRSQSQLETIVEFLKSEMTIADQEFLEKSMKKNEIYQDNFEVYIQTLISQALDSNFLTEIFQEQDDYFLSNVKMIDDITISMKQKLLNLLKWPNSVQKAVSTWPCFNIQHEFGLDATELNNACTGCRSKGVSVRVLLYGQPYNSTTLEGCHPDPQIANEKAFLMCKICSKRVNLLNKITHQKYLMYIECAKRVAEKRTNDPRKDTTCILNELLADENWLNQLFLQVRTAWAEVDSLEYNSKVGDSKSSE